jgi:hypothetical protein
MSIIAVSLFTRPILAEPGRPMGAARPGLRVLEDDPERALPGGECDDDYLDLLGTRGAG